MPHVYILECADGSYYTGSTGNLEQRIEQHVTGHGAVYTKKRLPVALVYAYESDDVREVFEWEQQIHGWSRAKKRALIEGRFDDLRSLARSHGKGRGAAASPAHGPSPEG